MTRELQRIRDGGAWKEFTIRTDGGGGTGYDAGGRRVRIEYPNDADLDATGTNAERLLTFEYDGNDRLERILDHPDPNDPGVTDTLGIYRYAGPGLRVAELDLHGDRTDPLSDPTEIEKTIAYDYLRRPTETEYRFTDTAEKREYRETWGDLHHQRRFLMVVPSLCFPRSRNRKSHRNRRTRRSRAGRSLCVPFLLFPPAP